MAHEHSLLKYPNLDKRKHFEFSVTSRWSRKSHFYQKVNHFSFSCIEYGTKLECTKQDINGFGMRLSYKFWRSNKARHDHGPKHNLLVASSIQVTSVGYEEIHPTWFLTYSISAHAWGRSEEHDKTDHLLAEYTETTQQLRRGAFLSIVSNFDNFCGKLILFYIST